MPFSPHIKTYQRISQYKSERFRHMEIRQAQGHDDLRVAANGRVLLENVAPIESAHICTVACVWLLSHGPMAGVWRVGVGSLEFLQAKTTLCANQPHRHIETT